ncbi:MAG: hypothetical protein A3F84_27330 [Candidatus Handelsmanbacteria bacterium RIFCSPLOWO2_12_FULL_64_10]|uniref:Metal-binding protein n=1 Tax=Handelsmanbacteria sp. (strain RIFCSPLOWO2_12_FULL_64_10) TaxID=1817868 RepID=A0A1F6C3B5_HANXR|nr:MAG: hypothetical protein A3F84_27330 [Candidatus Handelsmanbacteria bacterium RIFCSPLOWO2_12_FULL_64_10]
MPSGKTHIRIDVFFLLLMAAAALYFWDDLVQRFGRDRLVEQSAVFTISYLFGTFLLSPDLDLKDNVSAKNWGLLRLFWRPYAALFRHRGISHAPIAGTLTRILYMAAVIYVVVAAANALFDMKIRMSFRDLRAANWNLALTALAGVCLPDLLHVLTDRAFKR